MILLSFTEASGLLYSKKISKNDSPDILGTGTFNTVNSLHETLIVKLYSRLDCCNTLYGSRSSAFSFETARLRFPPTDKSSLLSSAVLPG